MLALGEGEYEASYVVRRAGEYQLVVGLAGDSAKSVFRGECAPGPVSPAHCEVQHATSEIAAGQAGQLRFWTADRYVSETLLSVKFAGISSYTVHCLFGVFLQVLGSSLNGISACCLHIFCIVACKRPLCAYNSLTKYRMHPNVPCEKTTNKGTTQGTRPAGVRCLGPESLRKPGLRVTLGRKARSRVADDGIEAAARCCVQVRQPGAQSAEPGGVRCGRHGAGPSDGGGGARVRR